MEGTAETSPAHINQTLSRYKRAFLSSRADPCPRRRRRCLFNLGAAYIAAGKPQKGLRCLVRYRKLQKQSGCAAADDDDDDDDDDGDLYFNMGLAYEGLRRPHKALPLFRRAARRAGSESGDPWGLGDALVKLAYCLVSLEDRAAAARSFVRAARAYQQAGRREDAAMAQREGAKHLILGRGAFDSDTQAVELLQSCLHNCKEGISDARLRGRLLTDVGLHYCALGRYRRAEDCFREALADGAGAAQTTGGLARAVLLQNLGAAKSAGGRYSQSLPDHAEAAQLFRAVCDWRGEAGSMANLAYAYSRMSLYQPAALCYQEALEAISKTGDIPGQCLIRQGLAAIQQRLGDAEQAVAAYHYQHGPSPLGGPKVQ